MNNLTVSVVVPVYNEGTYIKRLIDAIAAVQLSISRELIIVNDGSTDDTDRRIRNAIAERRGFPVRYLVLRTNHGKGYALKKAFIKTRGDIVVVLDADMEYSPAELPIMLEPFLSFGADAVYGTRFIGNKPHRVLYYWHYAANRFLTTLSNVCNNLNLTDMETGYKAFKGDIIRRIAPDLRAARFGFEPEITARLAKVRDIRIYEVGVSYAGRTYEEGKKIGFVDGLRAIWEILRYNFGR